MWQFRPITLEGRVAADPSTVTQDQLEGLGTDLQTMERAVECRSCHKRGHIQSGRCAEKDGQDVQGPTRKEKGRGKEGTVEAVEPQLEAWALLEEVCIDGDGQEYVAAGPVTARLKVSEE